MGLLDAIAGNFSLESLSPILKKEMAKKDCNSFVIFFDEKNNLQIVSSKENLYEEKKELERKLELLKERYSNLVEKLNRVQNGK